VTPDRPDPDHSDPDHSEPDRPGRFEPDDTETDSPGTRLKKIRSGEDFDILIGILGFWAFALFVLTAYRELTGQPALVSAMILLALCLALWGLIRLRRKLPARTGRRPH
jgi:hypothetical protein